jgi:hypothetical protein
VQKKEIKIFILLPDAKVRVSKGFLSTFFLEPRVACRTHTCVVGSQQNNETGSKPYKISYARSNGFHRLSQPIIIVKCRRLAAPKVPRNFSSVGQGFH